MIAWLRRRVGRRASCGELFQVPFDGVKTTCVCLRQRHHPDRHEGVPLERPPGWVGSSWRG